MILVEPDADQIPAAHHQTVVSMASIVGSGNMMSITELMKTHSLQLSTEAQTEQSSVQHVTVVRCCQEHKMLRLYLQKHELLILY